MIIALLFLVALIAGGVWSIWKALKTGDVEYGYKYYPPKYISNRKKDPGSFWFIVLVYGFAIIACLLLILRSWHE